MLQGCLSRLRTHWIYAFDLDEKMFEEKEDLNMIGRIFMNGLLL